MEFAGEWKLENWRKENRKKSFKLIKKLSAMFYATPSLPQSW